MDRLFLKRSPIVFGFLCQKTHSNRGSLHGAATPCWCWWCSVLYEGFVPYPQTGHVCDLKHSHARHDSIICFTWLIHCVRWFADMCHSSLIYMRITPNTHVCDMTRWHAWHDCFRCHSYVWHDSYLRVIWLIQMFAVTRADVWHIWQSSLIRSHTLGVRTLRHDSFTCVTWLVHVLNRILVCTYVHWICTTCRKCTTYRLTKIHRMAHFGGLFPQISIIQSLVAGEKSPNVKSSFDKRHVWI